MRATDRGWRSHIVARADTGIGDVNDLEGRRVGFGDADSPQAHILPVHALLCEGVDPALDFRSDRLDRDIGKHGDTGGAELAQLARVRARELDACAVSSVTLDAVWRLGDADELTTVWTSPPFHHCCFSVLDASGGEHERFKHTSAQPPSRRTREKVRSRARLGATPCRPSASPTGCANDLGHLPARLSGTSA